MTSCLPTVRIYCREVCHIWDIAHGNKHAGFSADDAYFSHGHLTAYFKNPVHYRSRPGDHYTIGAMNAAIHQPVHLHPEEIRTINFSPNSIQLLALSADVEVYIWDLECLHHDVSVHITSSYPPGRMMIQRHRDSKTSDGWFRGRNGARLIWLPGSLRNVWLATGKQHCRLILGQESQDEGNIAILDMKDYLKTP